MTGVNRLIASGMAFYTAMAMIQVVFMLAIAYLGLACKFQGETAPADRRAALGPGIVGAVLRIADRHLVRLAGG